MVRPTTDLQEPATRQALAGTGKSNLRGTIVEPRSTTGEPSRSALSADVRTATDLPVSRKELAELARWVPAKEMAMLIEICERAESDPDLLRPALLLCSAYAQRVARMLDQDPLPTLTRRIDDRLQQLRSKQGL
jgi:hypothetical protein